MSRYFRLTKISHAVRRWNFSSFFIKNSLTWRFLILIGVATLGGLYLTTMVNLSTHGYTVSALENNIQDLRIEQKKLKLQLAEFQAPQRLEEWVKTSGLVAATGIQYVSALSGTVAAR